MSNTGNFYEPEVYDARAQGVPGDIEFFLGLAKDADAAGHPVLELTTGIGRVATRSRAPTFESSVLGRLLRGPVWVRRWCS